MLEGSSIDTSNEQNVHNVIHCINTHVIMLDHQNNKGSIILLSVLSILTSHFGII